MSFILSKKYTKALLLLTPVLLLPHIVSAAGIPFMEEVLWKLVSGFFGMFVGFAGVLLDYSLRNFVIGFGSFWSTGTVGSTVDSLWINVRDIFNITFIFGLLYIGFKMILNSDSSSTKRALIHLILAALLVNFSLFFTKAVIDISNMFATEIAYDGLPIVDGYPSISTAFMGGTGLNTVLKPDNLSDVIDGGGLSYIFGAMIFYIVAAFVLAAGAFLIFIRFAVLLLYMIFSPFMFIGWVFPQLNNYTSKYWSGLLGRAFFAPLYILLIFLSMTILANFNTSTTPTGINLADGISAKGSLMTDDVTNNFPPFIIASILMLASVLIASKLGADGAKGAISIGRNATQKAKRSVQRNAQRGAMWTAKTATTQTAGRAYRSGSNFLGNKTNQQINKWQQGQRGKLGQTIASNRFVDKAMRGTSKKLKGAKGGLKETKDEQTNRITQEKKKINDRNEKYEKLRNGDAATIRNLSKKDLEELQKNDKTLFNGVLANLSLKDSTFNSLKDSDNLNQTEKDELVKLRKNSIKKFAEQNGQAVSENLQKLSVGQIETMGEQFITDNSHMFSNSQVESLKKNDKFTDQQDKERKDKIIQKSKDPQQRDGVFAHNTEDNPGAYTKPKKAKDVAALPFAVFIDNGSVNQHAISQINPDVLNELTKNKTLTVTEREQLKAEVLRNGTEESKNYLNTPEGQKNWNIEESNSTVREIQGLRDDISSRGMAQLNKETQTNTTNSTPPPPTGYSEIPGGSGIVTPNNPSRPRENRNNT